MKKLIFLLLLVVLVAATAKSQITLLDSNVNSMYLEFRPIISGDGHSLFFTVEGNPINKFKDGQDIWMSERKDSVWSKAVRLPSHINTERYNGVYWSSFDGNRILISGNGNGSINGIVPCGYSIASKHNGVWGAPKSIKITDFDQMTRGKFTSATLSNDEKILIFHCGDDVKGEWYDLWISYFNDETQSYSKPVKLFLSEEKVDEICPYIGPDNKTLYYSINKKDGVGNFDIWMTRRLDETWQNWSTPININTPINTKKGDIYLSISENDSVAYISTNAKYGLPNERGGSDIASIVLPKDIRPESVINQPIIDTIIIHDTIIVNIPCSPLDTMNNEQLAGESLKYKILFDFGSSVLRSDAYKKLDVILAIMQKNSDMKIEVGGHSDALGADVRNQKQSEERAISARGYLMARGIDPSRIIVKGYANTKPIADNRTDFGRQLNRRVDITVIE
jgi:outer membrane protein OmpA-like peptidoglycan-associated protein